MRFYIDYGEHLLYSNNNKNYYLGVLMFNLEKEIKEWKKSLRKNEALEDGYIAELECHLRDEFEDGIKNGKTEDASFTDAVKEIGDTEKLGEAYYKIDTTHLNKRPPWKENRFIPSLLTNYLKVARRNILRQKGYTFINITGLALGMACCILFALWVLDEISYDTFHENAGNIYGIVQTQKSDNDVRYITSTPAVFAQSLKDEFPEVLKSTRYLESWDEIPVKHGDKFFNEKSFAFADPSFLEIFSFPLLNGNKNTALTSPNSIILTEPLAEKYFGSENPIGKTIQLNIKTAFTVTGVMKKIPSNSIFTFTALIPFEAFLNNEKDPAERISWQSNYTDTFIQLRNNTVVSDFKSKLQKYFKNKYTDNQDPEYSALSLKESRYSNWYGGERRIASITVFSAIAFVILLIACINFINLSIVSSARRSLEIGLRKVMGATKRNIIIQFLGEFFALTILSFVVAVILVILFIPIFNELFNKELELKILFRGTTILAFAGIIVITAFTSGGYPALILSSLKPAVILKSNSGNNFKRSALKRFLVIFQFSLSTIMIIVMSVIYSQFKFIRNQNPGFKKEQILYIPLKSNSNLNYQLMKEQLSAIPGITGLTGASNLPSRVNRSTSQNITWAGKSADNTSLIYFANIDFDYVKTLGIKLIDGDDFTDKLQTDPKRAVLINEEMLKMLNIREPIGSELTVQGEKLKIIGVIKNFHFVTYHDNIPPIVLSLISGKNFLTLPNYHIFSISTENSSSTLNLIKARWKRINPMVPFEYYILDEEFDKMYKNEEKLVGVVGGFTLIAIIISALGLFGLASYTAEQRKKEIAVRKMLGSKTSEVVGLLIKEYFYLIIIANIIAGPVGYIIANKWLQDYAYKINIGAGIFIMAAVSAFVIMALAVGHQSIKAATVNPANSLRSE
ncbi:MAG: hypothetical protein C0412_01400 [Flavobacterium sp.]|nr:hypothetical protein [Flavobacterium sp.]